MQAELTPEQFQNVLKLCDMLSLEDFTVAALILKQANWNIEKALGLDDGHHQSTNNQGNQNNNKPKQLSPSKPPAVNQPTELSEIKPAQPKQENQYYDAFQDNFQDQQINYDYNQQPNDQDQNQFEYQYQYYQKQFDRQQRLQQKKRRFNQGFPVQPLNLIKTKSQVKSHSSEKNIMLSQERNPTQNFNDKKYSRNADYEDSILQRARVVCQKILMHTKSQQMKKYKQSIKKNQNNKNFIKYLNKTYQTKINFTLGTFLLNLARAYLDKKFLLVYVHKSQYQKNKSIKMIMNQKQISKFVNKNCICYGMFDSSDDYEILQKYVKMKNLPAFALFKLNSKELKEQFVSQYPILQSEPQNFLEWLASKIGITIKKKQNPKPQISLQQQKNRIQMSSIVYEQNMEYEQMARAFQMKRNKSQARKQSIQAMQLQIQLMKENFKQQPVFQEGKNIQIRFRLPMSGNSLMRVFNNDEKVLKMFEYIHCFGRDQFEERFSNFDLTQTFPKLTLTDKKQQLISQVFQGSTRQNIIVKQL